MEEAVAPQTEQGAGFEPPHVRQFTVFLDNRVGRLQTLVQVLEGSGNPIRALSVEESGESSLIRLICADSDAARESLRAAKLSFGESEMIAVEFPKRNPQPLSAICSALLAAEINIHYLYPFFIRSRGSSVALYVDDPTLAAQLLIRKGFTLIAESDLKK